MKLTELLPFSAAVNNGWTFAAFLVAVAVFIYFKRSGLDRHNDAA